MKRLLAIGALGAVIGLALPAFAVGGGSDIKGIATRNLGSELRTTQVELTRVNIEAGTTVGTTVGTNGLFMSATIDGGLTAVVQTTSVAAVAPHYAARLAFVLVDASANDTLACSGLVIVGRDQYGSRQTERFTSVTETVQLTTNAFESLESVTASGCNATAGTGATDAGDVLKIYPSDHVATGRKVTKSADVITVCQYDGSSGTVAPTCVVGSTCTVNARSHTIDLATCTSLSFAEFDNVIIRQRSSTKR